MAQLTIVPHGDSGAIVLPITLLKSIGVNVGDVVDVTLVERQLILRPVDDADRGQLIQDITRDVFEQRQDAYERLA